MGEERGMLTGMSRYCQLEKIDERANWLDLGTFSKRGPSVQFVLSIVGRLDESKCTLNQSPSSHQSTLLSAVELVMERKWVKMFH